MRIKLIQALIYFLMTFMSFSSNGQISLWDVIAPRSDSNIIQSRQFFMRFPSITAGASFLSEEEEPVIGIFGLGLDANIISKKRRRLILHNSINLGPTNWTGGVFLLESGIMTGLFADGHFILDVSYGVCYTRRYVLNLFSSSQKNLSDFHTIGIPFNIGVLSKTYPVDIDLGIIGNLNLYQPYVCANLRLRLGNPVKKSVRGL